MTKTKEKKMPKITFWWLSLLTDYWFIVNCEQGLVFFSFSFLHRWICVMKNKVNRFRSKCPLGGRTVLYLKKSAVWKRWLKVEFSEIVIRPLKVKLVCIFALIKVSCRLILSSSTRKNTSEQILMWHIFSLR